MGSPFPLYVKENFDAVIRKGKSCLCVTVVGRNYNREVIFVWTKPIVKQNPLKAKARRTLFAISKARELG